MIVFGSRMYGRKNVVKGWGRCERCGKYGKHTSYNARRWGHLYFVPIVPAGPRVRVMRECAKCKVGSHVPEKDAPGLLAGAREAIDEALSCLLRGEGDLPRREGESPTPCAAVLADAVELLYSLGDKDTVETMLAKLKEADLPYALHLVSGSDCAFRGDTDGAILEYRQAAEMEPNELLPFALLGSLCVGLNKWDEARTLLERAHRIEPERLDVLALLIYVYSEKGEHAKLAESYERSFELEPEIAKDKKAVKTYKAACKRAKRRPVLP